MFARVDRLAEEKPCRKRHACSSNWRRAPFRAVLHTSGAARAGRDLTSVAEVLAERRPSASGFCFARPGEVKLSSEVLLFQVPLFVLLLLSGLARAGVQAKQICRSRV